MGIVETLARQRNLLGLSIEDIASSTGMSARQVTAIEAGAFQLASTVEMNRMVRLYARKLGVTVDTDAGRSFIHDRQAGVPLTPVSIPRFLLKQSPPRAESGEKRAVVGA